MSPKALRADEVLERALRSGAIEPAALEAVRRRLGPGAGAEQVVDELLATGLISPDALDSGAAFDSGDPPTETLGAAAVAPVKELVEGLEVGIVAERYEVRRLLGSGGMGRVFLAFDRIIERDVALKLLHVPGAEAARRLLREARTQGRVSHENVCRVFDAGVAAGQAFVAMQAISGPTLRQAATSLSFTEKLEVMAQAAEGIHAAHRSGLIHRDLKPGNIMLERRPDGGWRSYVVDFGLVHDLDASTRSVEGIAGTPQYMAPEQVRGDVERIDWRADVYALGVTLFELMTGMPAVRASSPVEALVKVVEEDVRFPARPRLPRDLRAIIERCLEKDPGRRYGSARELADDLRRLLAGRPVLARPIGALGRLRRLVHRHPRLALASLAVAVAVLALAYLWLSAAVRGRTRAELARRFGEQAAQIEAITRYSALLPLHDVRPERRAVRERMLAIEREISELGTLAAGPGHYALGRGWLALGDADRARHDLERAWNAGYRDPDVASALGEALGAVYRRDRDRLRAISSPSLRRTREQLLETELRDGAVTFLRLGANARAVPPAYATALLARYEERWDDAIAAARQAQTHAAWLFEAARVEAEVWIERSLEASGRGDLADAEQHLDRAGAVLSEVLEAARSDAAARRLEATRRRRLVDLAALSGRDPTRLLTSVREAADAALALDPDDPTPLVDLALSHQKAGAFDLERGRDPRAAFTEAIRLAEEALACDPGNALAAGAIGLSCWRMGQYDADHSGGSEAEWLRRAVSAFDLAIGIDPLAAGPYSDRGNALRELAKYENGNAAHVDRRPGFLRAIDSFDLALLLEPGRAPIYYNRGVVNWDLGMYERQHGLDPRPSLAAAIADYRTALGINPALRQASNAIGSVYAEIGRYEDAQARDPGPAWADAERWFGQAIDQGGHVSFAAFNLALLLREQARRADRVGDDPLPYLERARSAIARGIAAAPDRNWLYRESGQIELAIASAKRLRSAGGEAELAEAERLLRRSRRMNLDDGNVAVALARWHVERAARGAAAAAEIERALAEVRLAETLLSGTATAPRIRGEVLLARARLRGTRADARAALEAFQQALAINANLAVELDGLIREAERAASR